MCACMYPRLLADMQVHTHALACIYIQITCEQNRDEYVKKNLHMCTYVIWYSHMFVTHV